MSNIWAAFGRIAGGSGDNSPESSIPRALSYLSEQDQSTFRKKFSEQRGDEHQLMHTFRELLVGVFMVQQGYTAQYEPTISGLTPDWQFQRDGHGTLLADVRSLHVETKTQAQIDGALDQGHSWSGVIRDQTDRLYSALWDKAAKYKNLACEKNVPYVVFIFGWMTAVVEPHQVEKCLLREEGLFHAYPTLSGVYHMRERMDKIRAELILNGTEVRVIPREKPPILLDEEAGYVFHYYANPKATCLAPWLTNGALPYRFPACSSQPRGTRGSGVDFH